MATCYLYDHHGFIELINWTPYPLTEALSGDSLIVQAARVTPSSHDLKNLERDRELLHFIMEQQLPQPLSAISFTFRLKVPIQVARVLSQFKAESWNDLDPVRPEMYWPELKTSHPEAREAWQEAQSLWVKMEDKYRILVGWGVDSKQVKGLLPLNTMTEIQWTLTWYQLQHVVRQLQEEDLRTALLTLVQPHLPFTWRVFQNQQARLIFEPDEIEVIKAIKQDPTNKHQLIKALGSQHRQQEFIRKTQRFMA